MRDEDLLGSLDDEIAAVVILAFAGLLDEGRRLSVKKTIAAVKHDREAEDGEFGKVAVLDRLGHGVHEDLTLGDSATPRRSLRIGQANHDICLNA